MKSIALKGVLVSVVAALGFLAVTMRAEADHTAAAVSVPAQVAVGETIEVSASLHAMAVASQGQPLRNTAVTFYATESFGGVTGKVEIGRAVTDKNGVATVKYEPRATGDHRIGVEYLVDGEGQTGASAVISVAGGTTQLYHSSSGIQIPGLNVGVLMALLATVWGILLSVALRVIVIAHAGSDSSASEAGPVRSMVGAR